MTEVPYLGEIGYVALYKSFIAKLLLWLVGLIVAGVVLYRFFAPKAIESQVESEELNSQAFVWTGLLVRGKRASL